MVSICVPCYNYDAGPLIDALRTQMSGLPVPSELLVYDDASPQVPTWVGQQIPGREVRLKRLGQNLGRGPIRNLLVREARYEYVVLLDVDGWPAADFLINYLEALPADHGANLLIIGGRTYSPEPPVDHELHLHWWYGVRRESTQQPFAENPYYGFQSNNFLASRQLLLSHPFPEDAVGYGHEDTLWGQQLAGLQTDLIRIDNPVVHLGLETNTDFLRKQRQAIANLKRLRQAYPELRTRLTDLVGRYPHLSKLASLLPEQALINYLTNRKEPELKALDLLKVKWFHAR